MTGDDQGATPRPSVATHDPRRRFNRSERAALCLAADGRCQRCGGELPPGWHADHRDPHSRGGPTDVVNGDALCPPCNLKKGNRVEPQPREWQKRFISKYHANREPDFILVACPGAGKTIASGFVARDVLRDGIVDRLLIVVPTAALREQWMIALASLGIIVDGQTMNNGMGEKDTIDGARTRGWVVTYQSLYSDRATHRILNVRRPTMAILDEIHHLGREASWGKAALEALEPCARRLGLSGTPFRRDGIPFVESDDDGMVRYRDNPDGTPYPRGFDYSYGRALHDNPAPVRPIMFDQYAGDVTWLDSWTGEEKTVNVADESLNQHDRSKANKHVLDHRGDWLSTVLADSDARLSMVQSEGDDRAQGLVLCIDTRHAHDVEKVLARHVGPHNVMVAVSKDSRGRDATEQARQTITDFARSRARWLVAVAMVSEGIDIPTLRVGVWATIVRSDLRFRQGMGRLIRRTPLPEELDQTAYLFVPKDPRMVELADGVYDEVKLALLEKNDEDTDAGGSDMTGGPVEESLPFDAFRDAIADDPSIHAPGLGAVDPEQVARIAQESGIALGAVAAVMAAQMKLGLAQQLSEQHGAPIDAPGEASQPIDSYGRRQKARRGELEELLKQVTASWLRREGRPYSEFGDTIRKIKADVYAMAGIRIGQLERADIPELEDAIRVAKKVWKEL